MGRLAAFAGAPRLRRKVRRRVAPIPLLSLEEGAWACDRPMRARVFWATGPHPWAFGGRPGKLGMDTKHQNAMQTPHAGEFDYVCVTEGPPGTQSSRTLLTLLIRSVASRSAARTGVMLSTLARRKTSRNVR